MAEDWKQWEGRTIKGEFPLRRFLGGTATHAVFLVEKSAGGRQQTAIRLLDANAPGASDQAQHWEAASKLDHPDLLRIFDTGRCDIDGRDFFYAWTEYGEEDLSQILPTRALTIAETRQILEAVLPALSYLHGQGLVHGSLKPSNIFAVADTVKLSTDTVRPSGEAAVRGDIRTPYDTPEGEQEIGPTADVWSLGVTLIEALTQQLPRRDAGSQGQTFVPNGIPQPFNEIVENCLRRDPAKRWTVSQIADRINAVTPTPTGASAGTSTAKSQAPAVSSPAPNEKRSSKWAYVLALVAALVIAAVLMARHKAENPTPESNPAQARPESPTSAAEPNANVPEQSGTESNAAPPASSQSTPSNRASSDGMLIVDSRDDVLQRVAPRVSPSARRTITGMLRVRLRLNVDANGNVTEARLQSPGPSKYFARVALEAAREWKFKPATVNGQAVPSKWNLRFGFSRGSTEAAAERTAP